MDKDPVLIAGGGIGGVTTALALAQKSLELAEEAKASVPDAALDAFDDQVLFPVRIFVENLHLLKSLIEFNNAYANNRRDSRTRERVRGLGLHARDQLLNLRTSLELGSSWEKWKGWYKPENFRIHTPPPKLEDFDRVLEGL